MLGLACCLIACTNPKGSRPNIILLSELPTRIKEVETSTTYRWVKGLYEKERLNFIVIRNMDKETSSVKLNFKGKATGLFSGMEIKPGKAISIPGEFCDMFALE